MRTRMPRTPGSRPTPRLAASGSSVTVKVYALCAAKHDCISRRQRLPPGGRCPFPRFPRERSSFSAHPPSLFGGSAGGAFTPSQQTRSSIWPIPGDNAKQPMAGIPPGNARAGDGGQGGRYRKLQSRRRPPRWQRPASCVRAELVAFTVPSDPFCVERHRDWSSASWVDSRHPYRVVSFANEARGRKMPSGAQASLRIRRRAARSRSRSPLICSVWSAIATSSARHRRRAAAIEEVACVIGAFRCVHPAPPSPARALPRRDACHGLPRIITRDGPNGGSGLLRWRESSACASAEKRRSMRRKPSTAPEGTSENGQRPPGGSRCRRDMQSC